MVAHRVLTDFRAFLEQASNRSSKQTPVLGIVGDLCVDRFVFGAVDRISPEAPVPVLLQERIDERLGCTANVCTNIHSLSPQLKIQQHLFSVIGSDDLGQSLLRQLRELDASIRLGVIEDSQRPTTLKTRFLAGSQHQLLRVDSESTQPLPSQLEAQLLNQILDAAPSFKVLVLQDYAKGLLSPTLLSSLLSEMRKKGVFTIVDPHRKTSAQAYVGASLIKPNVQEAEVLLGGHFSLDRGRDNDRVAEGARLLKKALSAENILITRSAYGMTLLDSQDQVTHFPALARSVFDVTGAGDTTVAVLAACVAAGASLKLAISAAVAASSVVVAKVGTATASIEEIVSELERI
jgi:D-beta-D-heptose 7-phosphate kinase/D-beta-D-heptose 1-phosphate adenosyltransferase